MKDVVQVVGGSTTTTPAADGGMVCRYIHELKKIPVSTVEAPLGHVAIRSHDVSAATLQAGACNVVGDCGRRDDRDDLTGDSVVEHRDCLNRCVVFPEVTGPNGWGAITVSKSSESAIRALIMTAPSNVADVSSLRVKAVARAFRLLPDVPALAVLKMMSPPAPVPLP